MNKPTRIKLTRPIVTSRQEAELRAAEVTELTLQLNAMKSDMDAEINSIREDYAPDLAALEKTIGEKTECLKAWAEVNPAEFGKARSIDMQCAVIGWRTGNYQIKPLAKWTWDRVLERLKSINLIRYIRTKEEVDKQTIIADRESLDLAAIGVRVFQEESFYIDPKITDPTTRVATEAQ